VIAVYLLAALIAGLLIGSAVTVRYMPRMIAKMSPEQVDALGAKVERARYGTDH
jgi:uncharacterized protein YneF (UPF0154 family)